MADHSRTRQGGWLRGKVGPSDLLLSQRVVQHKGISVLPIRERLLVCVVCYCLCNFSSQEDFPINQKKKKEKALHGLLSKQNVEHVCTQDFTPTHNFPSNVANGSCARTWRSTTDQHCRQGEVGKTGGKPEKRWANFSYYFILEKSCKFLAKKNQPCFI